MNRDVRPGIHLYIDRLILEGLPIDGSQAAQVQVAVETELSRLLVERGLTRDLQAGGAVPSVRTDAIPLSTGSNPAQMGIQIAQSVYTGIGGKE